MTLHVQTSSLVTFQIWLFIHFHSQHAKLWKYVLHMHQTIGLNNSIQE